MLSVKDVELLHENV